MFCRHVGDLGNIEEDSDGAVRTELSDDIATLYGEFSVMGRAMVVSKSIYSSSLFLFLSGTVAYMGA